MSSTATGAGAGAGAGADADDVGTTSNAGGPAIVAGARVISTKSFKGSKLDIPNIKPDRMGTVVLVDKDGDFKVAFDKHSVLRWARRKDDCITLAQIKVGDYVRAVKEFDHNKNTNVKVKPGTTGQVVLIDNDGDYKIKFEGHSRNRWSIKKKAEVIPVEVPVEVGSAVVARHKFQRQKSKSTPAIEKGTSGIVTRIDSDGDYLVKFDGLDRPRWALRKYRDVIASSDEPGAAKALFANEQGELPITPGMRVRCARKFKGSKRVGKNAFIREGELGTVVKVDGDGDFYVAFDTHSINRWALKKAGHVEPAPIVRGSWVRARKRFNHSKRKNKQMVEVGSLGKVSKVDGDGDYLIKFNEVRRKAWSFHKRQEVEPVPPPITVGATVIARTSFNHNKGVESVPNKARGVVREVDEDGDFLIAFEGIETQRWSKKKYVEVILEGTPATSDTPTGTPSTSQGGKVEEAAPAAAPAAPGAADSASDSDDDGGSSSGEASGTPASTSNNNGKMSVSADLCQRLGAINLNDYLKEKERSKKTMHRIMFQISPGEGGYGKGDLVKFTTDGSGPQQRGKVIGYDRYARTYDLQLMKEGKETDVVVPNVRKRHVRLYKEQHRGREDIDLKGVWGGDVSHITEICGKMYGFAVSALSGDAKAKPAFLKNLAKYFEEQDWEWDYYWVYYTGHGSSRQGAWCLPDRTRVSFHDVRRVWRSSSAPSRKARLVIVTDSCYAGSWVEALKKSGDEDIAVQAASVATSTSADMGWGGGRFTRAWKDALKRLQRGHSPKVAAKTGAEACRRQGSDCHVGWAKVRNLSHGVYYFKITDGPLLFGGPKE